LLFGVSIRENIRYSRPDATDEEIESAAKPAEIHDFIMSLPDKYDTMVGDFGVELSVGQKHILRIDDAQDHKCASAISPCAGANDPADIQRLVHTIPSEQVRRIGSPSVMAIVFS
jgi:hypothetical protein